MDRSAIRLLLIVIGSIVVMRIIGAAWLPIMDSQESRYAEIVRKMVELGQYLVPMSTYELPFWGKPPLAFWASALSVNLFGLSEFSVRFSSLVFGFGTAGLIFLLARPNTLVGVMAVLIFVSSHLGHTATGDITTDPALSFFICLTLAGFWKGFVGEQKWAFVLAVVGLAGSLLVKGPIAMILVGLTLALWFSFAGQWRQSISQLRLWAGLILAILLALPWYLLAEQFSPGFLNYFLVGEHFERFVNPEWSGDLYGSGHASPRGIIWYHAVDAMLPWSLLLMGAVPLVWRQRAELTSILPNGLVMFLFAWMLSPLLIFSLGSNVRGTYVMPALAPMALLAAAVLGLWLEHLTATGRQRLIWTSVALAFLVPSIKLGGAILSDQVYDSTRHQRPMIQYYQQQLGEKPGELYYVGRRRRSAEFYHHGRVAYLGSIAAVKQLKKTSGKSFYVSIHHRVDVSSLPVRCELQSTINGYKLFYCMK